MPQFPVPSPLMGVNRVVGRESQPPGTCWDAVNVLPYDRYGRNRLSQRHGLVKWCSTQLASTKIQALLPVPGVTYSATINSTATFPVSSFSHVQTGVTATSNNLASNSASTVGPSDLTQVNSTIALGTTLNFTLTYTGGSTVNAFNNFWVALSNGATTPGNIFAGNDGADIQFGYNPQGGANNIFLQISNVNFILPAVTSTGTLPLNTPIACSVTMDSAGVVSATFGNLTAPGSSSTQTTNQSSTLSLLMNNDGLSEQASTITLTTGASVSTGQVGFNTLLVAVAAGNVFLGSGGVMTQLAYAGVPSTARINSTNFVSLAYNNGIVFCADGSSTLWSINVTSTTISGIAASTVSSTTPVSSLTASTTTAVPPNCNLCCAWRGRIVLAGDSGNAAVWYMSRPPGQYFNSVTSTQIFVNAGVDWNFNDTDESAAIYGKTAGVNNIFEPITALIPFSNDYLKLGCAHSLWMFQGDPTTGNIVNVSQNIGVVGKDAWTVDPAGTLYFVATGGLYSCRPAWEFYRPPEPVTTLSVDQNFTQLNPGVARTTIVFDPDLHYLHVFMSAPPLSGTLGQHLTMDGRTVGREGGPAFWPQSFPSTMGPAASCLYFADGNPNNRTVLIGGNDGYIREWTLAATDDDGTAISAGVTLGPFALAGPDLAAVVSGVTIDLGETPTTLSSTHWGVIAKLAAGPDAYSVTEFLTNASNPKPTAVLNMTLDRRQKTFRQRMRGGWFTINLASLTDNSFFSFESAVIDFAPAGKNRERRQ